MMNAPEHLSPLMKEWFASVIDNYAMEPHHVLLLTKACEAYDRAEQARKAIDDNLGPVYLNANDEPQAMPEIAIERKSTAAFAALLKQLDLDPSPKQGNQSDDDQ